MMHSMKVLTISNAYPPYYLGGYELGCRDVMEQLKARGHQVKVLTSTYGVSYPCTDGVVYRWLEFMKLREENWAMNVANGIRRQLDHHRRMESLLDSWQPDVVYIWNLGGLSLDLPLVAQSRALPVCYFISDRWLERWDTSRWYRLWRDDSLPRIVRLSRALLRPIMAHSGMILGAPLDLRRVQFASNFLKESAIRAGKPVADADVIHWGVDLDKFAFREAAQPPRKLLFAGRICPEKGILTAIEAMKVLIHEHGANSLRLTIIGGNSLKPEYCEEIKKLVTSLGLGSHVEFRGFLPRNDLPAVYKEHDIFVFPSQWEEPFSIAVLEAMASGLAVVGTATGGSPEIMRDGENSLLFPKGDAQSCARQIIRLVNDVSFYEQVRWGGRRTVEEKFQLGHTVSGIELSLWNAVKRCDGVRYKQAQ